jgi:hypothetical protein
MDEYVQQDYLSLRADALVALAVNMESVNNKDSKKLMLEYMRKLVDSIGIEGPPAELKVIPFTKGE